MLRPCGADWVQVVGALINAVFLLALCFSIAVEAVERFLAPEQVSHCNAVYPFRTKMFAD